MFSIQALFGGWLMSIPNAVLSASLLVVGSLALSATDTRAEMPDPDNSAPLAPDYVYRMFAGKSADWGGGSGAYWAPDGRFVAVNQAEGSIGAGRWYATNRGRMCYEADWAWRQDFGVERSRVKTCTRFRVDRKGTMWSTTGGLNGPWFPYSTAPLSPGDQVSSTYSALAAEMGLVASTE